MPLKPPNFSDPFLAIGELERTVHLLQNQMAVLLAERRAGCLAVPYSDDPRLAEVVAITEEMFGNRPLISLINDPEHPDVSFLVLTVRSQGDVKQIVDKRLEWHEKIDRIPPGNSGSFRLTILPE